jgi:DNA helicase-2/ATP-dependent DNA helicase PcrA
MDILEGLNPEQLAAVTHDKGPLLVVAGAGTGKTQVITRRIAHLIQTGKARPTEVLALTFTEKAAREMEDRLFDLIGWESFQVPVMTFHAFGAEMLGRYASHIGRSVRGGLLNDVQKALLLRRHISELSLEYYGPQSDLLEFLEGIVAYIGELQNAGITPGDYQAYVDQLAQQEDVNPWDLAEQKDLASLYHLYDRIKQESGTLDYNDQLELPLRILKERPNIAERLAAEYRYVLVDEYQDTNYTQDALLRTFIPPHGNLFAVGDDDQAIYGFRGADIGNILQFADHFKVEKPAVLIRNYRSGQAILDAAYRLIQHNDPERLESKLAINKRLLALHNESTAEFVPYRTAADEVDGVLSAIADSIQKGTPARNIAVLSATHAPLRAMAKAMRTRGIPFALSTTINIFEQPELMGLWHLLQWVNWQADDAAIGHILLGPYIGWNAASFRILQATAGEQLVGLERALDTTQLEIAESVRGRIDQWRRWASELPVSQLVFKIIFETDVADRWRAQAASSGRMIRVFEDLQRLLDQMQDFESVNDDVRLAAYLDTFPKPPTLEAVEPVGDEAGVQLLTVHASKGLEFDTVYLAACSQRTWSGTRTALRAVPESLKAKEGVEELPPEHEFRRLMYVAVTRARQKLFVSAPTQTQAGTRQAITPFIGELFGETATKHLPTALAGAGLTNALTKIQRFYPMKDHAPSGALPFEQPDGWLDLSVTQLGAYDYCPFEFYLQFVLQIKQPVGPQMAFGSILHKLFEAYYKGLMSGHLRPAEELHGMLDEVWQDRGYESHEQASSDKALAHLTLDRFLKREASLHRDVIGSEVPIKFDATDAQMRLRGKIDVLFNTGEGVELRDFKTGRTKTDNEKLEVAAKNNFQLRTYALAYQELTGAAPASVVLDYVVTGAEGAAGLSSTILKNHRDKLRNLAGRIRERDFAPATSGNHECAALKYYGTGEQDELLQSVVREGTV